MITCKYSCKVCGIVNREVQVPARTTEDVVVWMQKVVALAIFIDHRQKSPKCNSETISDLMIPMPPGAEFVGQQIE